MVSWLRTWLPTSQPSQTLHLRVWGLDSEAWLLRILKYLHASSDVEMNWLSHGLCCGVALPGKHITRRNINISTEAEGLLHTHETDDVILSWPIQTDPVLHPYTIKESRTATGNSGSVHHHRHHLHHHQQQQQQDSRHHRRAMANMFFLVSVGILSETIQRVNMVQIIDVRMIMMVSPAVSPSSAAFSESTWKRRRIGAQKSHGVTCRPQRHQGLSGALHRRCLDR